MTNATISPSEGPRDFVWVIDTAGESVFRLPREDYLQQAENIVRRRGYGAQCAAEEKALAGFMTPEQAHFAAVKLWGGSRKATPQVPGLDAYAEPPAFYQAAEARSDLCAQKAATLLQAELGSSAVRNLTSFAFPPSSKRNAKTNSGPSIQAPPQSDIVPASGICARFAKKNRSRWWSRSFFPSPEILWAREGVKPVLRFVFHRDVPVIEGFQRLLLDVCARNPRYCTQILDKAIRRPELTRGTDPRKILAALRTMTHDPSFQEAIAIRRDHPHTDRFCYQPAVSVSSRAPGPER